MLLSPRFWGLDLPVHEIGTPLAHRYGFGDAAESVQGPTFLRPVTVDPPYRFSRLANVLKVADAELLVVAEMCGALVARHQWGLYPVGDKRRSDLDPYLDPNHPDYHKRHENCLPEGHILVAEVEVVKTARPIPEASKDAERIRNAIHDYIGGPGLKILDTKVSSFVTGIGQYGKADQQNQDTVLIDIEPRVGY